MSPAETHHPSSIRSHELYDQNKEMTNQKQHDEKSDDNPSSSVNNMVRRKVAGQQGSQLNASH